MVSGRVENRTVADFVCGLFKPPWMPPMTPEGSVCFLPTTCACASLPMIALEAFCLSQQRPKSVWALLCTPTPTLAQAAQSQ